MPTIFLPIVKILIAQGGAALVFACRLVEIRQIRNGRAVLAVVLTVLAVVSVMAYFDFGQYPKFGQFMNPHDFFHYYLGSKYSEELGAFNIYRCVLIADAEQNRVFAQRSIRNQETYGWESVPSVLRKADEYRGLFSPERWEAFKKDVWYFQSMMSARRFQSTLRDKGYNATPVWNMVAGVLTNTIPTSSGAGMRFLVALDLILLVVMFALVCAAFGWRTMLLGVVFFGSMYMMSYTHIRGAFLRLDWVTLLVMATCLIKLNRYKTAGALAAYAALARIFPLIFVFGLGVKFVIDFAKTRKLNSRYLGFFVVFGLTATALVGASIAADGGLGRWHDFFQKITLHNNDLSPIRVGFRYIFLNTHTNPFDQWMPFERQKLALFADRRLLWWAIQLVVLGVTAYLVKNLDDYETLPFGYVPAFFLTAPTFYYQVMILVPLFMFLPKLRLLPRAIGASGMFMISVTAYFLGLALPLNLMLSYILSWILLGLVAYMLATAWMAGREEREAVTTPKRSRGKRR